MVRKTRKRERNTGSEAVRGINKDMAVVGKELERVRDAVGTDGAALASAETKAHMLASKIEG